MSWSDLKWISIILLFSRKKNAFLNQFFEENSKYFVRLLLVSSASWISWSRPLKWHKKDLWIFFVDFLNHFETCKRTFFCEKRMLKFWKISFFAYESSEKLCKIRIFSNLKLTKYEVIWPVTWFFNSKSVLEIFTWKIWIQGHSKERKNSSFLIEKANIQEINKFRKINYV